LVAPPVERISASRSKYRVTICSGVSGIGGASGFQEPRDFVQPKEHSRQNESSAHIGLR
jgi:hypothetical protein